MIKKQILTKTSNALCTIFFPLPVNEKKCFLFFFFQDKDVNILHIESRKSRKKDAEFEILVDLECDNKRVHELIASLKDKVVHVVSHDGVRLRKTTSLDRGDTIRK